MKKFFVVFALLCAMVLMISCGGGSKTGDTSDTGETVTDEDGDTADSEPADDSEPSDTEPGNHDNPDTTPDNGDSGNSDTSEGLYVGIIGFNKNLPLNTLELGKLDGSSVSDYRNFIDTLYPDEGTSLYFADYSALEMISSHKKPTNLKHVALVTFTDGLDNLAMNPNYNPEKYESRDKYLEAIHKKIVDEKGIHDKKVEAYAIGLNGKEEGIDPDEFEDTLKNLSSCKDLTGSCDDNVSMASNMESAKESFRKIAESLYYATKTVNLDVKVPDGYDDGQPLRFTFDGQGEDSELYIEAKFHRSDDARTLEEISYHGLVKGKTKISGILDSDGAYYHFMFEDLKYESDKTPLSDSDINKIQLWVQNKNKETWKTDSEFGRQNSVNVEEHRSSALIMLVLDCTTSLGSDFGTMQQAGKEFINTLVNGNNNGSSGGSTTECSSGQYTCSGSYSYYCAGGYWDSGTYCSNGCNSSTGKCNSSSGGGSSTLPECSSSSGTPCKDSSSGLIWSAIASNTMTWDDAKSYCESYTEGGLSGWHLPTIDELRTLLIADRVKNNCQVSETNGCLSYSRCWSCSTCTQTGTQSSSGIYCSNWGSLYSDGRYSKFGETVVLWSSSTRSEDTDYAWRVNFLNGAVSLYNGDRDGDDKTRSLYVRCVRN